MVKMLRSRYLPVALFSLSLLFSSVGPGLAQGRKIALVVGNGAYVNMPQLVNPRNDASDIAAQLESLGFEVNTILDADRKQIVQALADYREALSNDSQSEGFFYYAGHGVQAKGLNYLIPVNADIHSVADLDDETVSLQRVMGNIEEARNRLNIVVLDACRNNPLPAKTRSAASRSSLRLPPNASSSSPRARTIPPWTARGGTAPSPRLSWPTSVTPSISR
jgi:Uncharacterized protein containing caspase domain